MKTTKIIADMQTIESDFCAYLSASNNKKARLLIIIIILYNF